MEEPDQGQGEFEFGTLMIKDGRGRYRMATDQEILAAARAVMNRRLQRGVKLTSPDLTREFLQVRLGHHEHEVFAVIWLDNRHRVIAFEELFHGTIDGATVHPREVVKACMRFNAAACILAHNHPSGATEPSQADMRITQRLKETLGLLDVRILDHFIVGEGPAYSLAEQGLL